MKAKPGNMTELQRQLGLPFSNLELLKQAFTHSSYVNEQRLRSTTDNERLEFLGDAVLELTISEYLYHLYSQWSEGALTKLRASIVCEASLVQFAERLQFGKYVLLGRGEEMSGGRTRPALLADVFEAFIGALFLDSGLDQVREFLKQHVFPFIPEASVLPVQDYKTQLQERVQHGGGGAPEYRIVEEKGPAHDREFVAEVWLNGAQLGSGVGRSKKEAEQRAAAEALQSWHS